MSGNEVSIGPRAATITLRTFTSFSYMAIEEEIRCFTCHRSGNVE